MVNFIFIQYIFSKKKIISNYEFMFLAKFVETKFNGNVRYGEAIDMFKFAYPYIYLFCTVLTRWINCDEIFFCLGNLNSDSFSKSLFLVRRWFYLSISQVYKNNSIEKKWLYNFQRQQKNILFFHGILTEKINLY